MEKAKNIMTTQNLTRLVLGMAVVMTLMATYVVITNHRPTVMANATPQSECRSVVVVTSGDTLSKLLADQGLGHNEIKAIADVL